jgi:hypothetical protein
MRRKYFLTLEILLLLSEAVVFSFGNASIYMCTGQLFVSVVFRVIIVVCIVVARPHHTQANFYAQLGLAGVQAVASIVFFAYAVRSMTNALRGMTRALLLLSTWCIPLVTGLMIATSAWILKTNSEDRRRYVRESERVSQLQRTLGDDIDYAAVVDADGDGDEMALQLAPAATPEKLAPKPGSESPDSLLDGDDDGDGDDVHRIDEFGDRRTDEQVAALRNQATRAKRPNLWAAIAREEMLDLKTEATTKGIDNDEDLL